MLEAMVELKPETERLVREELAQGHFGSVDELIEQGIYAWREKHDFTESIPAKPLQNLADFLLESPFAGSDLDLERDREEGRSVDL
jgi:Arc/MetJ-type ribon-helix-helix transcriptional regulator